MFYRLHPEIAGKFSSENAYSSLMDLPRTSASTVACEVCNGEYDAEVEAAEGCYHEDDDCTTCGWCYYCAGTGHMDCDRGYSCYETAAEMVASNLYRCEASDGSVGTLYEFDGRWVGDGPDGEPLVVPSGEARIITWDELDAAAAEEAAEGEWM